MKDITIIVPVHKLYDNSDYELLRNCLNSINNNKKTYTNGILNTCVICPKEELKTVSTITNSIITDGNCKIVCNDGETDFCSQVNYAVNLINTDFFSILEYDDEYVENWFSMAHKYYFSNEDVSVFLPINVQYNTEHTLWQYGNELVWASSFSNELGFIDFDCLQNCSTFNLTGGIFNTNDFKTIGGLKPSIKIAFNYEFLLRLTNKNLKVFVVPKEGYKHLIGRENSLTSIYDQTIAMNDIQKWFDLAKMEYYYIEDRKTEINKNDDELK